MTISIYRGKFYIKLYDKRNDYDFDEISFPYLDGNIPKGQSHSIFISQLIRYARINTSFSNFISDWKKHVTKLVGQYFDVAACANIFKYLSKSILMFGANMVYLCLLSCFCEHTHGLLNTRPYMSHLRGQN